MACTWFAVPHHSRCHSMPVQNERLSLCNDCILNTALEHPLPAHTCRSNCVHESQRLFGCCLECSLRAIIGYDVFPHAGRCSNTRGSCVWPCCASCTKQHEQPRPLCKHHLCQWRYMLIWGLHLHERLERQQLHNKHVHTARGGLAKLQTPVWGS
jgi:hypothetical protein